MPYLRFICWSCMGTKRNRYGDLHDAECVACDGKGYTVAFHRGNIPRHTDDPEEQREDARRQAGM